MDLNSWQIKLLRFAVAQSAIVKNIFFISYILVILFLVFGIYLITTAHFLEPVIYAIGKKFGQLALLMLGLVVLPGIIGRFSVDIVITRIITTYRRQLGILVFLLVLSHYLIVRLTYRIIGVLPLKLDLPLFETMGFSAFVILFIMFLTSNNLSVRALGKFWNKIHRFVYLVLWLVVLHTGLQRISAWTLFALLFASLEVISFVYSWVKKSKEVSVK